MNFITLNDGNKIPAIGFGTFQIPPDGSTYEAVKTALSLGIRHIDTAVAYFNEQEVGQAVKDSGIPREKIWITSKMWLQDFAYEDAKKSIDTSLKRLGTDYMEEAKKAGKIRSIGVSNMTPKIWNSFVPGFDTMPSVNQVEFNPYCQQKELRKILAENDVKLEAWAPLGQGRADLLTNPVITEIAEKTASSSFSVPAMAVQSEMFSTRSRYRRP